MGTLSLTAWFFIALATVALALDAYAIRKVFTSSFYEPAQRWGQTALILLVPLFGAYLTLYLAREHGTQFQSQPADHLQEIDGTCGDIDYHG
ncbi:hypothetical protein GJ698_11790 [Pseudoduganella sp. FT26W]|uniref:Uncharacterized protein n=1 Tax=Duganella aquatilis TaxID=2666082 RepID=A0A844D980_9BURK|nr:hypothetical protein [Duganella aquatilis]MRW84766.1 hypothetical protein [Duganella aquatilis]